MRKLVAELFGTFALVFAGTAAIVVNNVHPHVTHVGISLTFGLIVLALIYALGDVSGAHINPAVTLGFAAARRFPFRSVLPYILSQCAGALLASLLLRLLFPTDAALGATRPVGAAWQSFVMELILTLLLMMVILAVSTGAKEKGIMAGVAVGAVIALEALFAGPVSGASMNPARSLAPALVSGNLDNLWIYLTAPVAGALLAVPLGWYLFAPLTLPSTKDSFMNPSLSSTLKRIPFVCFSLLTGCAPSPSAAPAPKRVLFVCVENSNRSQMAEALARIHGAGRVEAYSAGSRPSGRLNPRAVEFMRELGYDLTQHRSKSVADLPVQEFDVVVGMGCGDEACAVVPARRREEWDIPDPKNMPPDEYRAVRDQIEKKVKELLGSL